MMITRVEFLFQSELDQETLDVWIDEEWLRPSGTASALAFSELDLARAKLIRELIHDLGVNHEGVGIILNLLDQMHGMRRMMHGVLKTSSIPLEFRSTNTMD